MLLIAALLCMKVFFLLVTNPGNEYTIRHFPTVFQFNHLNLHKQSHG